MKKHTSVNSCLLVIALILLLCSFKPKSNPQKHIDFAHQLIDNCSMELRNEENILLIGSGGGFLNHINEISAFYVSSRQFNVSEARKLYLKIVDKFLYKTNCNKPIRPYLRNYPFTTDNLAIRLDSKILRPENKNNSSVVYVSCVSGEIFYCIFDPEKDDLITIHEETYEEARKIIREEASMNSSNQILKNNRMAG